MFNGVTPHPSGISCTAVYPNRYGACVPLDGVEAIVVRIR
jgi:hypothetical protein